ncbi:MAG: Rnase Y domain-containing protein [Desulfobacterales bacterium]|nr:Rnase Y domain-containing protein [Desulfobacterales bacterium]
MKESRGLTVEEGKALLLNQLEDELKREAAVLIRDNEAYYIKETANVKSREILSNVMQRCCW